MNSGQAIGTFLSFVHCGGAELRAAVRPNGLGAARERGHDARGEEGDEDAGHDLRGAALRRMLSCAHSGQMSQTEANCASLRRGVKVGGTNAAPDCFRLRLAVSSFRFLTPNDLLCRSAGEVGLPVCRDRSWNPRMPVLAILARTRILFAEL